MSLPALKLTSATEPSWISVSDAAQRTGYSQRHLRRLCRQWAANGLARELGGNWELREDALASTSTPDSDTQNRDTQTLSRLTDAQRAVVLQRKTIIESWQSAITAGYQINLTKLQSTQRYLQRLAADGQNISERTLWGWHQKYTLDGLIGLIDGRHAERTSGNRDKDPFYSYLRSLYLTQRGLKIKLCHAVAEQRAIEEGWEVRTYSQSQRYLQSLDPALVTRKREGEKAFVDKHEPVIMRDYSTLNSNSWWVSDHHRFDVKIIDPRNPEKFCRPWITAWQDMRSRKIVGWKIFVTDPNTDTILESFVEAARSHGLPEVAYVDNGKDFDSKAIQGITKKQRKSGQTPVDAERISGAFNILQIKTIHAWPYHGQSKPIERFFGTLEDRFGRLQDTYCGGSTESRPENHQTQLDAGKAPTLSEFIASFASWLESDYHNRIHTGDSMDSRTPNQCFEQELKTRRTVSDEMLTYACMPRYGPLLVRQEGISYKGLLFGGVDAQVQKLYGKKIQIAVNNNDLSKVLVLDLEGRLICCANRDRKLGFNTNAADLRNAISEKRKLRKTFRTYNESRPRMSMVEDTQALLERSAARRLLDESNDSNQPLPPPVIEAIRTGLEDQQHLINHALDQMARQPMRKAVNDGIDHDLPDLTGTLNNLRLVGGDDDDYSVTDDAFDSLSKMVEEEIR